MVALLAFIRTVLKLPDEKKREGLSELFLQWHTPTSVALF